MTLTKLSEKGEECFIDPDFRESREDNIYFDSKEESNDDIREFEPKDLFINHFVFFNREIYKTNYARSPKDKFKHYEKKEISEHVMIHELRKLASQTKEYLNKNNVKDHVPVIYLLNTFDSDRIKDVCRDLKLEEEKLITSLIRNALSNAFRPALKEVLRSYLVDGKIGVDQIRKYFEKDEIEDLKELEKLIK